MSKKLKRGQHVKVRHRDVVVRGKVRKVHDDKDAVDVETTDGAMLQGLDPTDVELDTEARRNQLEVGQRVRFYRSHDKSVALIGRILNIHEDEDVVDIKTEVDGKMVEVAGTETAHVADVLPFDEAHVTAIKDRAEVARTDEAAPDHSHKRKAG